MKIEDITLQDIYDFMEHGSLENAPPGIAEYLELLDKVRGMLMRIDQFANDESIIKHLMLVDGLSRYKAKNIISEAREYFYKDAVVSKMAWRNIYAEKLDKVIHFAMLNMKDINDAAKISKMILDIISVRGVNEPDEEKLPEELFRRPVKLYSLDASIFEFGNVDRQKLSKMIDLLPELTEKEKNRIKQEALVPGYELKIFQDESENPRKG
jgi:hypothetical protein